MSHRQKITICNFKIFFVLMNIKFIVLIKVFDYNDKSVNYIYFIFIVIF